MALAVGMVSRFFVAFLTVYIFTALGGYCRSVYYERQYQFAHDLFNSPRVIGAFHHGLNQPGAILGVTIIVFVGAFFLTARKGMWLLATIGLAAAYVGFLGYAKA
jgi:hypothetical protein